MKDFIILLLNLSFLMIFIAFVCFIIEFFKNYRIKIEEKTPILIREQIPNKYSTKIAINKNSLRKPRIRKRG